MSDVLSAWRHCRLGDMMTLQRGHDLPVQDRIEGTVPIISSSGISGYHNAPKARPPGVVTGRYGTLGQVFYLNEPYWPLNTSLYVVDFKGNHPKFIYYLLKTVDYLSVSDKSSVPGVNRNHLHQLPALCPPVTEQKRIAEILGALDDKIELNRRMNATLEQMARALFRSWFVDFDPVRVKACGGDPTAELGLAPEIAALFPDSFQDSPLGPIPTGWNLTSLGDLTVRLNRGMTPKYADYGLLVLNQRCIRDRAIDWSKARRHEEKARIPTCRDIAAFDVLINSTGVGTLGRVAQVISLPEPCTLDTHVTQVRPNPERINAVYFGLDLTGREQEFESMGEGSTGQTELSRIKVAQMIVLVPPRSLQDYFDRLVRLMLSFGESNRVEAAKLAETREYLLPRLLSGLINESRVPS